MKKKYYAIKLIRKMYNHQNYFFTDQLKINTYFDQYENFSSLHITNTEIFTNKKDAQAVIKDLNLFDFSKIVEVFVTMKELV